MGTVEIKQVAVKSVDSSVANLRAAKEVHAILAERSVHLSLCHRVLCRSRSQLQATRSTLSLGGVSVLPGGCFLCVV